MTERIYALIANGEVDNVIVADADWHTGIDITDHDPIPGIGWRYDAGADEFTPPDGAPVGPVEPGDPVEPAEPPPEDRRITRLAFRTRFAQAELIAIEIAGLDNPAATMTERQAAAAIRVMMKTVDTANFIDLARADTRAGVEQLEAAGLLGEGRAGEILDADIELIERPPA
ncbi:MAG: hypothetical protein Q4G62_01615 [Pseudomonadota bacterium]|nr:hypothetical protein [Pseudomonadota bacterium]